MFDTLRFWESETSNSGTKDEEVEEEQSYKEELVEMWEDAKETDDPAEKAEIVEETVSGRRRTSFSEVMVNAVAADIANSKNDRNS